MIYNKYNRIVVITDNERKIMIKMKKLCALILSLGLAAGVSSCGKKEAASPNDFELVNNLGGTLAEIYISESDLDDWGENILNENTLENEKKLDVKFTGAEAKSTTFDIAVITQAGTEYQFKSIDLKTSNIITLTTQDGTPVASIQ